ncbi:hypothetical protein CIT292_08526 [Citrobacter youngae ATCC 29220]|uniref:Uncharacterized protein n=1 Tax=Citrobacter youngae ATCC 29220 TaxID=500640 RepID=D4BDF9_9ENTR|nr:hypothetical protein CIT292_08526 [Citrobacter youngae ATCC 29220]
MNLFTGGLYRITYNYHLFSRIEILTIEVIVILFTDFRALSGYL